MKIPEELVMAYADGELDAPERAAERAQVEAAMEQDPEVTRRVERHRALRKQMRATFDRVLDEPVPDRLVAVVRSVRPNATPGGTVTDLGRARAERAAASSARAEQRRATWSWPQWGAVAASLVIGAVVGHFALNSPELGPIGSRDGQLVAQGRLAEALSNQLASTQPQTAPVQIGTSFKAKSGDYCRTFVLHEGDTVGGVACRAGDQWNVNTLARVEASAATDGGYRPAGAEMPAAVRTAVEDQIVGDPLDSSAEEQAKNSGWK
jgi:anti-sigma factor RsiW